MFAVYFIAAILVFGLILLLRHLAAIEKDLSDIRGLLTTTNSQSNPIADLGEQLGTIASRVDDIASLARTYRKYNTFPLGPLGRPLIGSESEYNNRPE